MRYCTKCGQEIIEGAAFCVSCGAPVAKEAPASNARQNQEEQEFLENTHRLLVWERTAWSIASKAFLISGIAFAALFTLCFLIGIAAVVDGESLGGGLAMSLGLTYAIIFGGMFITFGIISKKACEKLPQYIDTVYTDFSLTYNRCNNIGMLVFTALFGVVSPVFFIINFIRMKANRGLIERIMRSQSIPG